MNKIDIVIFIVYLIGIVAFGSSFYRKDKSSYEFTTGNQKIPTWVITMSIFATFVSSISYLGLPGQAYISNWNPFVFSLSIPVASYMAVKFFVPLYRSEGSASAYTYLENRFGAWAKYYAAIMYLLTQLMRAGTILFLLAISLNLLLDWNIVVIIVVMGVSVMIYSLLGGIQAVVWTDAIQGIILILGAIACALILIFSMPDGPMQLFNIADENQKFSLGSFNMSLTEPTFWVVFLYGVFINLQNYGIDQNYVQRYMSANSDKEAKRSALFGGLLYVPMSAIFLFIGTALFSFYTAQPSLLSSGVEGDKVFPYFIAEQLPVGFAGLLIASIFAAGMSTISTSLNSSATVILTDFYKSPKNSFAMKVLYLSSFIFSLLSIGVALAMINVQSALDTWWKLASIFSGGMLGLFLLGNFAKHVTSRPAIIGVFLGVLVIGWMSLSPYLLKGSFSAYASPFHDYLSIVFGTSAIIVLGLITGWLIDQIQFKTKKS